MNEEGTASGAGAKTVSRKIKVNKVIVPFESSGPDQEPLFTNYFQVAHAGGSYYIDAGILPLDDILSPSDTATFMVLNRLVMSESVMAALRDQLVALLAQTEGAKVDIVSSTTSE